MARLLLPPGYPIFGSDGALSAAAEAFVYEPSTTTDKTVYQDEALSTAHPQPIQADANGIIAGGVYGSEDQDYKISFKTSGGSTIRTIDPIPNFAVTLASIADGTRGDLIAMGEIEWAALAIGAADRLLKSNGTDPSWGQLTAGMVPDNLLTLAMMAHQTAGDIIFYNDAPTALNIGSAGQVLTVNSGATAPEWAALSVPIQGGTLDLSSGSGGEITDFGGVAAPREFRLTLSGVTLSGSDNILVRLGTGGATTTSGYDSAGGEAGNGAGGNVSSTTGFIIRSLNASRKVSGTATLTHVGSNEWVMAFAGGLTGAAGGVVSGGNVTLAGAIDRVAVVPTGSNTFDGGNASLIAI